MSEYECVEFLPHDGKPGKCARCGSDLSGRRRRWCSTRWSSRDPPPGCRRRNTRRIGV